MTGLAARRPAGRRAVSGPRRAAALPLLGPAALITAQLFFFPFIALPLIIWLYDADASVAAFAARTSGAVALDELRADLPGVIGRALEPAHQALWLTEGER